jgi:hypothetical protein
MKSLPAIRILVAAASFAAFFEVPLSLAAPECPVLPTKPSRSVYAACAECMRAATEEHKKAEIDGMVNALEIAVPVALATRNVAGVAASCAVWGIMVKLEKAKADADLQMAKTGCASKQCRPIIQFNEAVLRMKK